MTPLRVRLHSSEEAWKAANQILYGGAVVWLGILAFVLSRDLGLFWGLLSPFGGDLAFGGWAVAIFGGGYIALIYPLYRDKSAPVFFLTVGLVEQMWLPRFNPSNLLWTVYALGVFGAFWLSVHSFRAALHVDARVIGLTFVFALYNAYVYLVPLPGFSVLIPYDILGFAVVLSATRSMRWHRPTPPC